MAKFEITYFPDGTMEKKLTFMGEEYVCRSTPFVNGISRQLDHDLFEQLEATGKYDEKLLNLVDEAFDAMIGECPQDAIVRLTEVEEAQGDD